MKSTVHLAQAEAALVDARSRDAQNQAVYEYTMAIRYLEKAREENGSADYRVAEDLAKRSVEWSDKAIIKIEGGQRGLDFLGEDFGAAPAGSAQSSEELFPESDVPSRVAEPEDTVEDTVPDEVPETPKPKDEFDLEDEWEIDE